MRAVEAGCDGVLVCRDLDAARQARDALAHRLDPSRLAQAAARMATLRAAARDHATLPYAQGLPSRDEGEELLKRLHTGLA